MVGGMEVLAVVILVFVGKDCGSLDNLESVRYMYLVVERGVFPSPATWLRQSLRTSPGCRETHTRLASLLLTYFSTGLLS